MSSAVSPKRDGWWSGVEEPLTKASVLCCDATDAVHDAGTAVDDDDLLRFSRLVDDAAQKYRDAATMLQDISDTIYRRALRRMGSK